MKHHRNSLVIFAALFAALLFAGCPSVTLDPAGPYRGDTTLYQADLAIKQAYALTDAFLKYEETNRATVGTDVKKLANNLRDEAPALFADAVAVRDAYVATTSPEAKSRLMNITLVMQKLIERISAHLPQPKTN